MSKKVTAAQPVHNSIESTISDIEKRFGEGAIMRLGKDAAVKQIDVIPTRCISLDKALGVGGFPRGRIIEIYGNEASGKSTHCLHVVASAQALGGIAAYIDVEHSLSAPYAENLGVDLDNLLVSQPENAEQALEITEKLVASGQFAVVVVDSVAALVPRTEVDGESGDMNMGLQARLMSQAMRKLTPLVSKTNTCLIFVNQLRQKIGVFFGNPDVTTGGKALKFYSSVRLEVKRIGPVKDKEDIIGSRTKVKVAKNKVAPPFKEVEYDIIFGKGISFAGDLLDNAIECGVIKQKGSWFTLNEESIGQGREKVRSLLEGDSKLYKKIEKEVTKKGTK